MHRPVPVPEVLAVTLSVATILAESALRHPDRTAVVLGPETVTYRQLWEQARRYAAVLRHRGVGPGDKVALLLPNITDFPRAYYGALALGAVVVPVHALLTASEIQFVLEDSGSKVLVCAGPLLGEGARGAELAGVDLLTVMGGDDEARSLEALARQVEPVAGLVLRELDDDAVVLYTSGTTGMPKGAVLTHSNMVFNAQTSAFDTLGIEPDDTVLGCLPLFHSFGQTCAMNAAFRRGAKLVLMPRFDGPSALELMVSNDVTVFQGVPTMYVALLEAARNDTRRPQLRVAVSGGAALPLTVLEKVKEVFGADILEGYGLSETSPVATFNQHVFGRKPGTVGCPIWGVEVEIAEATVEDRIELLPTGELGEIVIRGHNVMKGYLNRPDATAAAVVDGWFRSGDLGTKDEDGFITIVDRKKDMVLRGGFNVYPREVEEVLLRHPGVGQVAVIGVPDPQYGEEVCAVVVKSSEAEGSDDELAESIRMHGKQALAKYKYPRRVEFVDGLPLGPSGKVLKRELTARYGAS
jgi:long-chain acyl-CoA synthetase